jgi:riboflavin biosynthesis pyrimidine reductase
MGDTRPRQDETVALAPLEALYDATPGEPLPLPPALAAFYGPLRLPASSGAAGRPLMLANFVSTLDGVVALGEPGYGGGGAISGYDRHDKAVMGLLRAISDAVVVGAGTLRSVPRSLWTAEHIYPPLAPAYAALRAALGKTAPPLNVIVTAHGTLDLTLPVFASGEVPALIVTTPDAAAHLAAEPIPASVRVAAGSEQDHVSAADVLSAIRATQPASTVVLVEGGPQLMADFLSARLVDDLFLTLAPQIAGRDVSQQRPGLVEGALFLPHQPLWGQLRSIRRSSNYLYLRYGFGDGE